MVHFTFLLWILSAASNAAAYQYRGNGEARISLFEPAKVSKAATSTLTELDCDPQQPSKDISLPVDSCLWGDYSLVNNFKITTFPTCGNGATAVAFFYSSTSCTGPTSFRSDKQDVGILDRCLFGSSSQKWSMIFRCSEFKSHAVSKRAFQKAIPPNYTPSTPSSPTDGVLTPYFSYDCTIYRPKQPTPLPADTCLTLDVGHSIHIAQSAVCANGKAALVQTYDEESCSSPNSWLGTDAFSDSYFGSIDKKCHTTNARSVAFLCHDQEIVKFEDLPKQEGKTVEQLTISELPPPPKKVEESEPSEVTLPTGRPEDLGSETEIQNPIVEALIEGDNPFLEKVVPKPYFLRGWFKALLIIILIASVITGLAVWELFGMGGALLGLGGKILAWSRRGDTQEPEGQIRL
jgi:hypothetical protein